MAGRPNPDTARRYWIMADLRAAGHTHHQIATAMGETLGQVQNLLKRHAATPPPRPEDLPPAPEYPKPEAIPPAPAPEPRELPEPIVRATRPRLSAVVDVDPQPFAVPIATAAPPVADQALTAVVFGDSHVPYEDRGTLAVAESIIRDARPDILLHMGDLVDCWSISSYERDPARILRLQDEIDQSRTKLHQWAQLAPQARRVLLEGNHEDRLRRLIWALPDTARELARLRKFQEEMVWPRLLDLDGCGWEWVPTEQQSRAAILPIVTVHGHQVTNSGSVAGAMGRRLMAKYGRSGVAGHIHRAAIVMDRDHNGTQFGIEAGCTCLLDGQTYVTDPNWQAAVTVLHWTEDRRVMEIQQAIVRDGRALWRGREYRAA